MEIVIHTCGQKLYRHETGGVQKVVIYGRLEDQREIHDCPRCSENLSDTAVTPVATLSDTQNNR